MFTNAATFPCLSDVIELYLKETLRNYVTQKLRIYN